MMFGLYGKMQSQPGKRDELLALMMSSVDELDELEGCYSYILGSIDDDPDGIWVAEVWRSQADHQASLTLESVQKLIAAARPLIAGMSEGTTVTVLGGKGLPPSKE